MRIYVKFMQINFLNNYNTNIYVYLGYILKFRSLECQFLVMATRRQV